MSFLFHLAYNLISIGIFLYLMDRNLDKKLPDFLIIFISSVSIFLMTLVNDMFENSLLNLFTAIFMYLLLALIIYDGKVLKKLVNVLFFVSLYILAESLVYVLSLIFKVKEIDNIFALGAFTQALVIGLLWILTRKIGYFYKDDSYDQNLRMIIFFSSSILLSLAAAFYESPSTSRYYPLINLIVIILSHLIFYQSLRTRDKKIESERRLQNLELSMEASRQYYKLVEEHQKEIKTLRHDLINKLNSLLDMSEKEKTSFIKDLIGDLSPEASKIYTENTIINYIIIQKLNMVEIKAENLRIFVDVEKNLPMDKGDLATLLGNSLDNSVEALEKLSLEDRVLDIKIIQDRPVLLIKILNSYEKIKKI